MGLTAQSAPETFDRRQKWLLWMAWGATVVPLLVFAYLTWASYDMRRELRVMQKELEEAQHTLEKKKKELGEVEKKKAELEKQTAKLAVDLDAQRNSAKHYRDYAGVRIVFYRESDRKMVEGALRRLGFKVEDAKLGSSKLISRDPNTIAYGNLVSTQDLRDIAIALVQEKFPLKRIAPATKQPDPKLIQIYASTESDAACGLLTVEQVKAGETCGPKR
jgi:hypothetical protein